MSLPAVIFEERLRIPSGVHRLAPFRLWCAADEFPEKGRIDFLAGDVEVDMSPEDLHTHGTAKTEVAARLQLLVADPGRGEVFINSTRVVSATADLSVEPDIVVVLGESLAAGRVRFVPTAKDPTRSSEIECAPDLIVEIVSDSSESIRPCSACAAAFRGNEPRGGVGGIGSIRPKAPEARSGSAGSLLHGIAEAVPGQADPAGG